MQPCANDVDGTRENDTVHAKEGSDELLKIENGLDSKVWSYNKFTKVNPMKGVTWDKSKNKWVIRCTGSTFATKKDSIDEASKIAMETVTKKSNFTKIDKPSPHKNYADIIISYDHNGTELFDIMHVIVCLGVRDTKKKYNQYVSDVAYFSFEKNEYGGYFVREYVSYDVMSMMVFGSNKVKAVNLADYLGIGVPRYTLSKEQETLNVISTVFAGEEIVCQKNVNGYRIDMYFPQYNIAIECDELGHRDRDPKKEKDREQAIKNAIGCTFVRYDPDSSKFNINVVCNTIFKMIKDYHNLDRKPNNG